MFTSFKLVSEKVMPDITRVGVDDISEVLVLPWLILVPFVLAFLSVWCRSRVLIIFLSLEVDLLCVVCCVLGIE